MDIDLLGITSHRSEKIARPLEKKNIPVLKVPDYPPQRITELPGRTADLYKLIHKNVLEINPDVVFVNGTGFPALITCYLSRNMDFDIVVRLGGNPWRSNSEVIRRNISSLNLFKAKMYIIRRLVNNIVFRLIDGCIVVSKSLKNTVIKKDVINKKKVEIVHVPVDTTHFRPPTSPIKNQSSNTLLTVTNLHFKGKLEGVLKIIESIFPLLIGSNSITYNIAGGGIYYSELQEYISLLPQKVKSKINLLGHVSDLRKYYRGSDIFVYVSYMDAYPNVVIEAMASGLPVVSNSLFGMSEQIEHGKTGFLISPDRQKFKDKIIELIKNKELRDEMGRRGRQKVKEENSFEKIGEDYIGSIKYIINS